MGRRHLRVLQEAGATVIGIADASGAAVAEAGDECGIPSERRFTDTEQLLGSRPDLVVVATTAPSHGAFTRMAAESGASMILCEKPMATSLAECDAMMAACARSGARLAINHQMRFMAPYQRARDIVRSEEFGGLSSLTVVAGNVGLAMNAIHHFELFRYLTGETPRDVSAWLSDDRVPNPRGPQYEDRGGSVRLTTPNGVRFYLEAAPDQGHGLVMTYAGPYGWLFHDQVGETFELAVRAGPDRRLPSTRYDTTPDRRTISAGSLDVIAGTRAVLESLVRGENFPSGEDGRLAIEILVGAFASSESGHTAIRVGNGTISRDRVFHWA